MTVSIFGETIVVGAWEESSNATRVNANPANNSATHSGAAYIFSIGGSSAQEQWRTQYFGSAANSGDGADDADPDFDGLVNSLEFAAGSHPLQPGVALIAGLRTEAGFEFTYTRNKAALTEMQFAVEWSDNLAAGSWSTAGVSESIPGDDGTLQQVKTIVPLGDGSRRYVRLRVTNAP